MESENKENKTENSELNIVGVKSSYEIIFDNLVPKIILNDILQPIVKVENCTWLTEL